MIFSQFNKLKTSLAMSAVLLGAVACSDYDDDITSLSDRIDNIESSYVTISSMESQIDAVRADIPDLTSIYTRLDDLETNLGNIDLTSIYTRLSSLEGSVGDLEGDLSGLSLSVTDLENAIEDLEDLETAVSTLQEVIDNLNTTINSSIESTVTKEFLTTMLDDVYLVEVTLAEIKTLITTEFLTDLLDGVYVTEIPEVTEVTTELISSLIGDENSGLIYDIVSAMASASEWVGNDALGDYLLFSNYVEYTDEDAKAAAAEYFETVKITVLTAQDENGNEIDITGDDFYLTTTTVSLLDAAVESLTSRVAELEGRIQSLVFVPETAGDFAATFAGKDYVTISGKSVYLTPVSSTRDLTFRVSPASWAEKFNTENVSLYPAVEYTRAIDPFSIVAVTPGNDGLFTVTLKYNLDEAAHLGYGLALHIEIDAESADATSGTDYTSSYVSVNVEDGVDQTGYIVYGGYYGSNFDVVASSSNSYYIESLEMQYDYTDMVTFFSACDWYVYDGSDYALFTSLYTDDDILSITKPTKTATLTPTTNSASYTLSATTAQIKSGAGSTSLIGDVITSDTYTFALINGSDKVDFGTAISNLTITQLTHTFQTTTWDLNWTWNTTYYTSSTSTALNEEIITIDNSNEHISAEMFNRLYNGTSSSIYYVYESDGVTPVYRTATSTYQSYAYVYFNQVNNDDDARSLYVDLRGMPNRTGNYIIKYVNDNVDGDKVEINIPVKFTGMGATSGFDLILDFDYTGQTSDELISSIETELWEQNEKVFEDHVTDANFTTIMSKVISYITNSSNKMSLAKTSDVLSVNYNYNKFSIDDFGTPFDMSISFTDYYTSHYTTYDVGIGAPFATINVSVTLNNTLAGCIQAANAFVDSAGNVEIETELVGGSFDVVDKNLISTHTLTQVASGANVVMTYTIVDDATLGQDLTQWIADNPTLAEPEVVNGTLYWNAWNSTEIQLMVTASLYGIPVDNKVFTAYIKNPLSDITTTALNLYIDDVNDPTVNVDLNNAISQLISTALVPADASGNAADVFPTYQLVFGSAPTFSYAGTSDSTTTKLVKENGSVISFSDSANSSAVMQNAVEYYYTVTYATDYFGTYTETITVKVNEAGAARN